MAESSSHCQAENIGEKSIGKECSKGIIKKLPLHVINRIAAGEVIQRPSSALKELLENSIDSGASKIIVEADHGGLSLLQITDNGSGIQLEDYPILCERFTTSKLKEYDDLKSIATFGFRGEALASISYVSNLSVISKTQQQINAYQAFYCDGSLVPGPNSKSLLPSPCAGNDGTIITIKDMFYNHPVRKASMTPNQEYLLILEIVNKYSINFPSIKFSCRQSKSKCSDIITEGALNESNSEDQIRKELIRKKYGSEVHSLLLHFSHEFPKLHLKISVILTKPILPKNNKRTEFILFINERLVESKALRKKIDEVYSKFMPDSRHYFCFFRLKIQPKYIDVNVHPTKKEVKFINEEVIFEAIAESVENQLKENAQNPAVNIVKKFVIKEPKILQNQKVRVSFQDQTIEQVMSYKVRQSIGEVEEKKEIEQNSCPIAIQYMKELQEIQLQNQNSQKYIKEISYIGILNPDIICVQFDNQLMACKLVPLLEDWLFQITMKKITQLTAFRLEPSFSLLEVSSGMNFKNLTKYANFLYKYFHIEIMDNQLCTLPLIILEIPPYSEEIMSLLQELENNFELILGEKKQINEKIVIESIAKLISKYFSHFFYYYTENGKNEEKLNTLGKILQNHFLIQIRNSFVVEKPVKSYFIPIVSLQMLYKIFERV